MSRLATDAEIAALAKREGLTFAQVKTVVTVEARGRGHLSDGRPKILFEGHRFYANLPQSIRAKVAKERPDLCFPKWTKKHYKGGAGEWDRLADAIAYHREAALKSCSWGLPQLMGKNYKLVGLQNVQQLVNIMYGDEIGHIELMIKFIKQNSALYNSLRLLKWETFARYYNGPGYKENEYDTQLSNTFKRYEKNPFDKPVAAAA